MSVTFGAPLAALAGLAGAIPIAVALLRERRAGRVRAELSLAAPPLRARLSRPVALACAFALLGVAAAQPSVHRSQRRLVRSDAQLLVALDNSRSMLAAAAPGAQPRYRRAVAFARRLHLSLPRLAAGVASLDNRLLPYLFPTPDERAFDAVLSQAYGIQRPPPRFDLDHWVTTFGALGQAGTRAFFSPGVRKRVLVVLSDAETRPFAARAVLDELRHRGVIPVVVRFWRPGERIFRAGGAAESYRATQPRELVALRAAGWQAFPESSFGAVVGSIQRAVGAGPVVEAGYLGRQTSIAPALALAALGPLLLVLVPPGRLPSLRYRPAPFAAK